MSCISPPFPFSLLKLAWLLALHGLHPALRSMRESPHLMFVVFTLAAGQLPPFICSQEGRFGGEIWHASVYTLIGVVEALLRYIMIGTAHGTSYPFSSTSLATLLTTHPSRSSALPQPHTIPAAPRPLPPPLHTHPRLLELFFSFSLSFSSLLSSLLLSLAAFSLRNGNALVL